MNTKYLVPVLLAASMAVTGCGPAPDSNAPYTDLSLDMSMPDSLTGGKAVVSSSKLSKSGDSVVAAQASQPCSFIGGDQDNPFRNGYEMSKFLNAVVASWTCIADTLIDISAYTPHDGVVYQTDNDVSSASFDPDEPTHYSVTDDSATQVSIRLYYGYARNNPPQPNDDPQFYIAWDKAVNGDVNGRLIIDATLVNPDQRKPDDPTRMRMDFSQTQDADSADMFLQFDAGNAWADAMRIQVTKDLTASPLGQVFTARGLVQMKAQFLPVSGIGEVPDAHIYTVSDRLGNGAAVAGFHNISLPLPLNVFVGNDLGNYLFSSKDTYFFQDDQDWDWIHKAIVSSEYRGGRTTAATGGTWLLPFSPSLDMISGALLLDADYFTGSKCANVGDDCNQLLNAILNDTLYAWGPERNQGSDPGDWRSTALASPDYLTSVYPDGSDWNGAFDYRFNNL